MDILFLRHGESEGNAQGRMQGRRDFPLSALGLEQAARAAQFLGGLGLRLDAVYASPLLRARETAQVLCRAVSSELEIEDDLAEIGAGSLEGLNEAEISQRFPGFMQRPVTKVGDFGEFGGESYDDVQARVARVRARLEARHREQAHRVLLVGHGGFNFQLLKTLICEPVPRTCIVKMGNCTMTLVRMRVRRERFMGEVVWHVPVELMGVAAREGASALFT
ncbi:MAG TPA: histidine phosphatase family protein [Polyangiaceae bacterium]|jgi:probable phosphoglycerate mutase